MAEELSEYHHHQLLQILKFTRNQRDTAIREIEREIQDTAESRLTADDYSNEEAKEIFTGLQNVVKSTLHTELQHIAHCNAVLVRQLFLQAENHGVNITADTSTLENKSVLDQVAELEKDLSTAALRKAPPLTNKAPLAAMGGGGGGDADSQKLLQENLQLKERLSKLQTQCTTILKEKTAVTDENLKLKDQIDELKASAPSNAPSLAPLKPSAAKPEVTSDDVKSSVEYIELQEALTFKEKKMKELQAELEEVRAAADDKINNSSQFKTMKTMVAQKNEQLKKLRTALAKYEPVDDAPDADA